MADRVLLERCSEFYLDQGRKIMMMIATDQRTKQTSWESKLLLVRTKYVSTLLSVNVSAVEQQLYSTDKLYPWRYRKRDLWPNILLYSPTGLYRSNFISLCPNSISKLTRTFFMWFISRSHQKVKGHTLVVCAQFHPQWMGPCSFPSFRQGANNIL